MGVFGDFFSGAGDVIRDVFSSPHTADIIQAVGGFVNPPQQSGPVFRPQIPATTGGFTGGGAGSPFRPGFPGSPNPGPVFIPGVPTGPPGVVPDFTNVGFAGAAGSLGNLILRQLPGLLGGVAISEGLDFAEGAPGMGGALFTSAQSRSVRPVREITALHPVTGRPVTWVNRGRALLYSGDLNSCRRVAKVASLANKRTSKVRGTARKVRRRRS